MAEVLFGRPIQGERFGLARILPHFFKVAVDFFNFVLNFFPFFDKFSSKSSGRGGKGTTREVDNIFSFVERKRKVVN